MIGMLRGRLIEKQPHRVLIDVGGVGYDVAVPLSTFYTTGDPGTEITLRVHTHVREDQIALFGFATPPELAMFERLIAVSGVGPKLALSVLSGMDSRELAAAIQRGDVARLTRIPGVGRKTAERLVVELRDRLPAAFTAAQDAPSGDGAPGLRDDVVSALANLGYHRQSIDKVLDRLLADTESPTFEQVLRAALRELARV